MYAIGSTPPVDGEASSFGATSNTTSPDFSNTNSRTGHVSEADGGIGSGRDWGAVDAVGANSRTSGGEHPALVRIGVCLDAQKAARLR
jgi:hypothetical protein